MELVNQHQIDISLTTIFLILILPIPLPLPLLLFPKFRQFYLDLTCIYNTSMSLQQEEQQSTHRYLFIITPLEIKSSSKIKANHSKSILIKLGNKTAKCTEMNVSTEMEIDVLYSKTLQKYCPIKGIIKIYDVNGEGAEIISCVGGFQTEEMLNQGKTSILLEKQLGASRLKMSISIVNKNQKQSNSKVTHNYRFQSHKEISSKEETQLKKNSSSENMQMPKQASSPRIGSNLSQTSLNSGENKNAAKTLEGFLSKKWEGPLRSPSTSMNKPNERPNQTHNFKRYEELNSKAKPNDSLQSLKQQLSTQKQKAAQLQDKYNKCIVKMNFFKSKLNEFQSEAKANFAIFKKLISELDVRNNKLETELSENTKTIKMRYTNRQIENTFKDLIELACKRVKENIVFTDMDANNLERDYSYQSEEQHRKEVAFLKMMTMEKDKKIGTLQKELEGLEGTIRNQKETIHHINDENHYLREKNNQIEMSQRHKQGKVDALHRQIDKLSQSNQELQKKLNNSGLQNEQLREEVSNCNETIEEYRQKYGDLKTAKNRVIEMEIKQCIRWIDQQDRDLQLSGMEETVPSENKEEQQENLFSTFKNNYIERDQANSNSLK